MEGGHHIMLLLVLTYVLTCFIKGGVSQITEINLVDGADLKEGRLEVLYNGVWGTVCHDYFSDREARVVCRSLGYSDDGATAWHYAYFGQGTGPVHLSNVVCDGNEESLNDCESVAYPDNCEHDKDVSVDCDFSPDASTVFVRLEGGARANEGRVEVIYRNSLGTICDTDWDDTNAMVICSMLGYQSIGSRAADRGSFTSGTGRIWVDKVNCEGSETLIYNCPTTDGWLVNTCSHGNDAGVICSTDTHPDNFVLVTDSYRDKIYRMDLSTFSQTEINHNSHFRPIAIGYDHISETLYWSDVEAKQIKQSNLDGTNDEMFVGLPTYAVLDGLAIDPISRNLFFTDTGLNSIIVFSLEDFVYKFIITSQMDEPRGIALHPDEGYIFWTDWGTYSKIERANMDGSGRTTLIDTALTWPNGIAIDYENDRIYWADASTNMIEKADFDGNDRRIIYTGTGHMFGLALVGDFIYYTDWTERHLIRITKDGQDNTKVGPPTFGTLNEITAFKANKGIYGLESNGCTVSRGGCSHICVPKPSVNDGIVCLCPYGMNLVADKRTCA